MKDVNVGVIGLGNVGSGTLAILHKNSAQISQKLGFNLRVVAVCSRSVSARTVTDVPSDALQTPDWREVVAHPDVQVVAELVGGTSVAREMIEAHGGTIAVASGPDSGSTFTIMLPLVARTGEV